MLSLSFQTNWIGPILVKFGWKFGLKVYRIALGDTKLQPSEHSDGSVCKMGLLKRKVGGWQKKMQCQGEIRSIMKSNSTSTETLKSFCYKRGFYLHYTLHTTMATAPDLTKELHWTIQKDPQCVTEVKDFIFQLIKACLQKCCCLTKCKDGKSSQTYNDVQ